MSEPISQQWYEAATLATEAKGAADLLEQNKSSILSQMMMRSPEKSIAAKEMATKASKEWQDYIAEMCKARRIANLLEVKKEYLGMVAWEQNSHAANQRLMSKMG